MAQAQVTHTSDAVCSFRDPAGVVIRQGDRILRLVNAGSARELTELLKTPFALRLLEERKLVATETADLVHLAAALGREVAPGEVLFEHERVVFPSYAYEWPPEMLHAAGDLTLELALAAIEQGYGLKDATPSNVLFRGPNPVFVDLLSFEKRDPLDGRWVPYAQFIRNFLLPLLANRELGIPLSGMMLAQRDGLEPEQVYAWAGPLDRLRPPFLSLVTLPKWLGGGARNPAVYRKKPLPSADQARFVVEGILKGLRRQLSRLTPKSAESVWTGYLGSTALYDAAQFDQKERFVRQAMALATPSRVLDVGANEGHFSALAASEGASVVAIDSDAVVAGRIWRLARARDLDILPLVVDITRPTPGVGWRNREADSFLDRARGRFDLVLMLAVIHHMLVTERVPLPEILRLAFDLTREYALIEFVGPGDPMFQRIVRGRESLNEGLSAEAFERAAGEHFDVVRAERVQGMERWLYLLRKKTS